MNQFMNQHPYNALNQLLNRTSVSSLVSSDDEQIIVAPFLRRLQPSNLLANNISCLINESNLINSKFQFWSGADNRRNVGLASYVISFCNREMRVRGVLLWFPTYSALNKKQSELSTYVTFKMVKLKCCCKLMEEGMRL